MASLSTQQTRENVDASHISCIRQPHHRFTRYHQYYQQYAVDHSTIYPIISQRGGVVSVDGSRGGDSVADYDNLIPLVRLDRIVEDEADREDGSINNVHYDNAGTRGSSDASGFDKNKVTQMGSGGLDDGGCYSGIRRNILGSCGYHCAHKDVCGNTASSGNSPVCEYTDNKYTMGNVLFASHTGSVADSSSSSTILSQRKRSFVVVESSKRQSDLGNSSTIPSSVFDREKPSIRLSEAPEMPSCSLISDALAKEFVNAYRKHSADFGSPQDDPCSTFSNAAGEVAPEARRKSPRIFAFVTEDVLVKKPSESIAGTSDTRPNEFDSGTSPTCAFKKDNFPVPVTTKHTRSLSTTEGCHKVSGTEKKLLYDREKCKEADDHQKIPFGKTPVIVITQSTPKRQPSNTSERTQFSDCQEQANAVCKGGEKTNGAYKEYKKETNTWESQASSSGNRNSNDRPKTKPVRSASVDESSDIPYSICDSDKDTSEPVVLYGRATDVEKYSSYTEHLAEPFKAKAMPHLTKVTDGEKLSEVTRMYNSSTAATATATSTASTTVAITNASMQLVSTTAHHSRQHTAEDLKLSSYADRHYSQSNTEEALEPAVENSMADYAMPYDANRQNAINHSQGAFMNVNMNKFHKEKLHHTPREPLNSLAESDSVSLCEPQYTEISEAVEPRVTQSSLGRFQLGSDDTHYKVVRLCDPAQRQGESAEADAIYAVPIPKSQRKTDYSNTFTTKPALQPKQLFAEPDSPPKPARSPLCSPESTVFEDTDNPCDTPVTRNKVQVTCQMKQPTATGRFYSDSSDYDYSNIPKFGRYEFFSLGRRPKRLRSNSLRNSKEVSVSLEMMLKLRHESLSEMPVKSAADETTSVDDILRSCREFDQSQSFYRGRTSSDSTHNSYLSSLSFVEIANIKKHIHDTRESENNKLNQLTTFKVNGIQNKLNGALKVNGDPVTPPYLHATKHDASNRTVNFNWLQSNNVTQVNMAPVSSSQQANSIGQNGQMIERKTMSNGPASSSHGQQRFASKDIATNITESAQLGFDSPPTGSKHTAMYNEGAKNSSAFSSEVKCVSRSDYAIHNSDYDCLETVQSDPSASSPNENLSQFSYPQDILFNIHETRKHYQIRPEGTETVYSQRCFPLSSTQKPIEDGVHDQSEEQSSEVSSTTHEALRDQLLSQSLSSSSVEIQCHAVIISKHNQQQATSDISSGALTTRISPESPMSSSDVTSPVTPVSMWSASGGDFSPGFVSTNSEDASESSGGELSSPTQKSSICYARLEIAEALKWLRAAGFPQYAQMFEEGQFPVDMGVIERDHDFLDQDSLKSLFRRLEKLNKYADLSLDTLPGKKVASEEEEEEDLCALSDRWEYKKSAGRWSRKGVTSASRHTTAMGSDQTDMTSHSESQDSLLDHYTGTPIKDGSLSEVTPNPLLHSTEQESNSPRSQVKLPENASREQDLNDVFISASQIPVAIEKNKSSNNMFRKMDVLKNKRSRGMSKRRNILDISGPIVEDSDHLRAKLERLNCVDISPSSKTARPELSSRSHASSLGNRAVSVERTENQKSSEFTSSQATVQTPPNSHSLVQPSSTNHISVQSQSSSHILIQHPPPSHILVQSASFSHTNVQSPPTSHISIKSPSSSYISVQSPSVSQFPVQSPPYSTSKATLSGHETIPHATKPPPSPNSATLTNLTISNQGDISSANLTPLESDSKLNTHNENAAALSVPSVQRDKILENATIDLDIQDGFSRVQDHQQPRRFPRVLESGYIQTGFFEADTGARNNTTQYSNTSKVEELKPYSSNRRHRNSVYDNIEPDDRQEKGRMIFPGIYELENCDSGNHSKDGNEEIVTSSWQNGVGVKQDKLTQDLNSEYNPSCVETVSVDDSVIGSLLRSCDQPFGSSVSDVSVSFEPSPLQSPGESAPRNEKDASISETKNDTVSDFTSKSKGVVHSSSLDSYFQNINLNCATDGGELTDSQPRIAQKEYDDFDLILQQLYQNINELSDYVSRETDINNSLEFDGALDLDPENSFSGGEGSNTAESSSEDPELVATDVSRDSLDQISSVSRERRDSGVGHSLPRPPSERRQKKLRWNSFQNSHKPDVNSRAMQINQLTVYQMVRLQKLCLLKLTAIMEKCLPVSRSGWNWMMPRFMKKQKTADFIDRKVFGVPLSVMAQRTGQPLPQCVLHAMRYLRRTSPNAVGIFRKSGVKSKIQQLRDYLEAHPDTVNFEGVNAYNVADMLKTYFRDLPECLLTNKMSEIFRSIYMHVPPSQRLEALQTAIVLLPDENREVLQSILLFLSDISSHEADHQMNANNLAVCFTPTVFQLGPQQTVTAHSPKRNHKTSIAVPDPREMMEQKAAHECLLMMILECKKLFTVFPSLYQQLQVHAVPQIMPVPLLDIGCAPSDVRSFGQERIQIILKEAHDKNRGWLQAFMVGDVEVFHRKPMDDCPLKEWKLVVEIEAPPIEVLHRILHERHVWDEDLLSWSVVERMDPHSDIFQFVLNSMAPHPFRHFCVLRYWRSDLNKGACALITMSVEHSHPMEVQGVRAVDLGSYFLMEHCGSGRSRLTYITRLDTRGRSPEWYTRIFGHISANFLTRLKESFRQVTPGPETRV